MLCRLPLPARLPACRLMAAQISLLQPHLGGKAYSLRSAIVHAIGSLLHKAFDTWVQGGGGGRGSWGSQRQWVQQHG